MYPAHLLKKDLIIREHLNTKHLSALLGEGYNNFLKGVFSENSDYHGGISRRLQKGTSLDTFESHWEDAIDYFKICECGIKKSKSKPRSDCMRGNVDIAFSLGGFKLRSYFKTSVRNKRNNYFEVKILKWDVLLTDRYDFAIESLRDRIAAEFKMSFKEAHCFEKAGMAKPFTIISSWSHMSPFSKYTLYIK